MKQHKSNNGQTLIEVLVALSAAIVIIAAIVAATLNSLKNSDFVRDQNTAAAYSQQGMEIIRNMRDESIASLSATYLPDGTYCLASSCTALDKAKPSCWTKSVSCGQNVGIFIREVKVEHSSADCNASPTPTGQTNYLSSNVKFTVSTFWYDTACTDASNPFCHSITTSSCFSDFTILPTP